MEEGPKDSFRRTPQNGKSARDFGEETPKEENYEK